MVFSSLIFIYIFLPAVAVVYYLAKNRYRNYILLVASLLFYAYGEPHFVFVMMASILINYLMAVLIDQANINERIRVARNLLCLDIVINIGLLFVFKYLKYSLVIIANLTGRELWQPEIVLPIGISFFTFQAMSYCIDVYRGTVKVQKNLFYVALYISFFPQLIAGPIVRYSTIEKEITDRSMNFSEFGEGVRRFFLGFAKKMIIANNLAIVAKDVWEMDLAATPALVLWIGSLCFSLQIFFDFSAYSDMAIGLGRMFGFRFSENFDYPYTSKSVTEFWRRWHISLGQWFRDYVYIPLGGSRVSVPRNVLNLFIVWLLTGIWHGANITFVVWGLMFFVLLCFEKWIVKPADSKHMIITVLWTVITLVCVNFGWVIFNSSNLHIAMDYIKGMLRIDGSLWTIDDNEVSMFREYGFFMILGILFSMPIVPLFIEKIEKIRAGRLFMKYVSPVVYGLLFLWGVSYILVGSHNPFIYFNF